MNEETDITRGETLTPYGERRRILAELAGAASLCWTPRPAGVFESDMATTFVDGSMKQLEALDPVQPRNIFQRLNMVQKAVEYVKKDTRVEGKYNAVTHDAVTALVRPHFVKHGIVLNVNVLESRVIETGQKSSNGTPLIRYEARFAVHFINMDDPHNYAVFEIDAHANDFGDKAPGKALSYAVKGAVLKALYLETGENDEGRAGGGEDRELTEEEELRLQELRDASLNGMKALEVAWKSMNGKIRLALAPQLAGLKEAAQKAQEATNGSV